MASETERSKPELGIWIRFWDLALAFGLLVAAFLWRQEKVVELRGLADSSGVPGYFTGKHVLLDSYRGGYSFDTIRDHLRAFGEKGRDAYAHEFLPFQDVAMTLFLMTFLILFILYATQSDRYHALGLPSWVRILLLLPPILQFCFDVGENFMLRSVIEMYPRLHPALIDNASQCTQLKWATIYVNALIVLGLGGYTLYQWLAGSQRKA